MKLARITPKLSLIGWKRFTRCDLTQNRQKRADKWSPSVGNVFVKSGQQKNDEGQ